MNDWNIQARAHACGICEQPFADKQHYHTALFEESEELRRQDVCMGCWEGESQAKLRGQAGFISHWQGVYEAPPPPDAEPIEKENAESLLRKLVEIDDPKYVPARYILAVMLERKRLLRIREELRREGQRVFVYEQPKSGDIFTIVDPALQLDQLEAVQREVAMLMEHGLNSPAPSQEAPAVDEAAEAADALGEQCAEPSEVTTT